MVLSVGFASITDLLHQSKTMIKRVLVSLTVVTVAISAIFVSATPNAEATSLPRTFVMGGSTWTVTSGPTFEDKTFDDENGNPLTTPAIIISGSIDPPLSSPFNVTAAELKDCTGTETETDLDPLNFQGGANGASFTFDVKRSAATATCKSIGITYTSGDGSSTEGICIANPRLRRIGHVLFDGVPFLAEGVMNFPTLEVIDSDGNVDQDYTGDVLITVGSLKGSGGRMNGSFGTAIVAVQNGVGTFSFELVRGIPGDRILFDVSGPGRINSSRSSMPTY